MTPREKRFCAYYAAELSASRAAVLAGYAPRSARQIGSALLTKHDIQAEIDRLTEAEDRELIAQSNEVLRHLTSVMRDPTAKPSDRLRAAEGLAKARGLFRETREITVTEKPDRPRVQIYLPKLEEDEDE